MPTRSCFVVFSFYLWLQQAKHGETDILVATLWVQGDAFSSATLACNGLRLCWVALRAQFRRHAPQLHPDFYKWWFHMVSLNGWFALNCNFQWHGITN